MEAKIKEDRAAARRQELATKEKIAESVKAGRQRPMLLDSYNSGTARSNLAKLQATKKFLDVMAESGVPRADAVKKLTPAEKEQLEEEKFLEARRK